MRTFAIQIGSMAL